MVNWALNNLDLWVKQFLIAENNYRVRFEAAEVLMMLIPDSGHLYNYWKSCVDKFSLPDSNKNGTVQYEERVLTVVHKVCSFNVGFSITGFPRALKRLYCDKNCAAVKTKHIKTVANRLFLEVFDHTCWCALPLKFSMY